MKAAMTFLERGYAANLFRIRAANQRRLAEQRSASATRQELDEEAEWCELQAKRLDDAEEAATVSDKKPVTADPRLDIDAVDKPKNGTAS